MIPLLHRPTFLRAFDHGLHLRDEKFASLVLLVCATASRYSDDPRVLENGHTLSAGWKWFQQVEPFSSNVMAGPELYDLQVATVRVTLLVCLRQTDDIIACCCLCLRCTSTSRGLDHGRRWSTTCSGCRRTQKTITQCSSDSRGRTLEARVLVSASATPAGCSSSRMIFTG